METPGGAEISPPAAEAEPVPSAEAVPTGPLNRVIAFDFEMLGPCPTHAKYAVGWARAADGALVPGGSGKLLLKIELCPSGYDLKTFRFIMSDPVASSQLMDAMESGLSSWDFREKLQNVFKSAVGEKYRVIADMPNDVAILASSIEPLAPHMDGNEFISGPYITTDVYRGALGTLDAHGLGAQIDKLIGFSRPAEWLAHDPEYDAMEIALRFSKYVAWSQSKPERGEKRAREDGGEPAPKEPRPDAETQ